MRSATAGSIVRWTLLTSTLGAATAGPAFAAAIDARTLRVSSPLGTTPITGASAEPALNADGRVVAFTTAAVGVVPGDERNEQIADVVLIDGATGERRLVSEAPGGVGANGASGEAVLSSDGKRVVFASDATNLVAGDDNRVRDIFVRDGVGAVRLVSAALDGSPGNRPSRNPDVSADGRFVVFESDASDLVLGDSNGQTDVFVRDLVTNATARVSVSDDGDQGTTRSGLPAISGDGRIVSFESSAKELVPDDTNRQADVFVRDLVRRETTRVSISTNGKQQNASQKAPFRIQSDLDATGRRVVFDSEASNLVRNDTNRRSDVFLHDRRTGTTRLVSASTANVQGNNDSIAPVITPSGRRVAFQSFATNLVGEGDGTGADIFVRDLSLLTTSIASVAADGTRRQPELVGQALQRAAISEDGDLLAFTSSAPGLVPDVRDRYTDVYVRAMAPPTNSVARRSATSVRVEADDKVVKRYVCRVDLGVPFSCGPTVSLRRPGRRITIRAMGPGTLPDPVGQTVALASDRTPPRVRITSLPKSRVTRTIRGVASDRGGSGVARVELAVTYGNAAGRCFYLDKRVWKSASDCRTALFRNVATGRSSWRFKIPPKLPPAVLQVVARTVDGSGNRSTVAYRVGLLP